MSIKTIIDETKDRIETVTTNEPVVTSYESFDPTLRQPWIRISVLPSESNNITQGIDSILEDNGLMQVDIFTPSNTDLSFNLFDTIRTAILNKRKFPSFQIDRAWRGVDSFETDWIQTPLLIRWRKFIPNIGIND